MKRIVCLSVVCFIILLTLPCASALGTLPEKNDRPRHTVCTALSDSAKAYYTGAYRYENLCALSGAADASTGYTAMQDNALFDALHALMSETHRYTVTYSGKNSGSLAYFWTRTDAVGGDTYTMFYTDVPGDMDNAVLNREHVWPKSRASFGTKNGGSDLHHLRPSVDVVNRLKSNHTFGDVRQTFSDGVSEGAFNGEVCCWVMKDQDLFECKDDVKGDVARILLYVYCRWEQPNLYADIAESQLPAPDKDSTGNSGVRVIDSLDTLLSWCAEDPVDTWEMRRNDLTESVQGNRNVFIDYPELAWRLFGVVAPQGMVTPSSAPQRLLGDVDRDGEITILDATCILRKLAVIPLPFEFDKTVADTDESGDVTVFDVTMLQRALGNLTSNDNIGKPV